MPALQAVANVVDRRQSMQILGNVLLNAHQGTLNLTATDMEVEVSLGCGAEVIREGATTLPARKLLDICRSLPSDASLQIDVSSGKAKVQSGRSRFSLGVLPADDFPAVGSFQNQVEIKIRASELSELVRSTQFAMAHQDVRYYLNGLLLVVEGKNVIAVATDGHRLAFCQVETEQEFPRQEVIIPRKTIIELQRLLEESDEPVQLEIANNQVKLTFADIELISKLVEGKFPDYTRVVPKGYKNNFTISRDQLLRSLQRAAIMTSDKFKGVRWVIAPGSLKISSTNSDQEEAVEELEIDYGGDSVDIGFNVTYLLDVLNNLKGDYVNVALGDANSSALITIPDNADFKYVVMPMRI